MQSFIHSITIIAIIVVFSHCTSSSNSSKDDIQVDTSSGILTGFVDLSYPNVRQFLGIPFSLPPTGARRWLPPSMLQSNTSISATRIGPACPQLLVTAQSPLNVSVYAPNSGNQSEFFPLPNFSEDCLTLNVWTPLNPKKKTPVFVWFFGGGFTQGGTSSLYFNPESWVQRTQEHTVVTVNFRSGILGFPNAAELSEQNLGLLDQRLALEWVRDNIAVFGGDPSKIVDWGESAGAIAVDYLDFAYHSDPIVAGRILSSGTAMFTPQGNRLTSDFDHNNFTSVAEVFGCVSENSQVDCLRDVSWTEIEAYLATAETQNFTFLPVADENVVFANYSQRYEMGATSSVPVIIGTNQHELNALAGLKSEVGYSDTLDLVTNETFLCTAAITSRLRQAASLTTFRYRYDGNFSNISPGIFTGAYHGAELPLIFGTAGKFHGVSTRYEEIVGTKLQDLWLEFAKDPENGLKYAGWSTYGEEKAALIGGDNSAFELTDVSLLDGICAHLSSII
jgi:acetylcholinesterase